MPRLTRGKVEWRLFRGWTDEELKAHLATAATAERNFTDDYDAMTTANGWDQVSSTSRIGMEPLGGPVHDGTFERAWGVLERYEFSDPRIVRAHFDATTPMEGRPVMLELRAMGLRYLCPVRISAVRFEPHEGIAGFRIDTLRGHIETGAEWFLVRKDSETGEVRFRIRAAWRTGEFPNVISWLGFLMFGRRYQRAWHRLSHLRMCDLTAREALPAPKDAHLIHEGIEVSAPPITEVADGRRWLPTAERIVEREREEVSQLGVIGAYKQDTEALKSLVLRKKRAFGKGPLALAAVGALATAGGWVIRNRV